MRDNKVRNLFFGEPSAIHLKKHINARIINICKEIHPYVKIYNHKGKLLYNPKNFR